jgi:hypothetical protein
MILRLDRHVYLVLFKEKDKYSVLVKNIVATLDNLTYISAIYLIA